MLDDLKKKEEERAQKVLKMYQRRQTSTGSTAGQKAQDPTNTREVVASEKENGQIVEDIEDSAEQKDGEQYFEEAMLLQDDQAGADSPRKPPQMMSEYKRRQQRKAELKKLKRQQRKDTAHKSEAGRWLRDSAVPEEESSAEDDTS